MPVAKTAGAAQFEAQGDIQNRFPQEDVKELLFRRAEDAADGTAWLATSFDQIEVGDGWDRRVRFFEIRCLLGHEITPLLGSTRR